jgi:hypothetical protein
MPSGRSELSGAGKVSDSGNDRTSADGVSFVGLNDSQEAIAPGSSSWSNISVPQALSTVKMPVSGLGGDEPDSSHGSGCGFPRAKSDSGFDKSDSGFDKSDSKFDKSDSGFDKSDSGSEKSDPIPDKSALATSLPFFGRIDGISTGKQSSGKSTKAF